MLAECVASCIFVAAAVYRLSLMDAGMHYRASERANERRQVCNHEPSNPGELRATMGCRVGERGDELVEHTCVLCSASAV